MSSDSNIQYTSIFLNYQRYIELEEAIQNATINRNEQLTACKDYTKQAKLYLEQGKIYCAKISDAATRKRIWGTTAAKEAAQGNSKGARIAREKVEELEREIQEFERIKGNYGVQHEILLAEARICADKATEYKEERNAKTEELRRFNEEIADDDSPTGSE